MDDELADLEEAAALRREELDEAAAAAARSKQSMHAIFGSDDEDEDEDEPEAPAAEAPKPKAKRKREKQEKAPKKAKKKEKAEKPAKKKQKKAKEPAPFLDDSDVEPELDGGFGPGGSSEEEGEEEERARLAAAPEAEEADSDEDLEAEGGAGEGGKKRKKEKGEGKGGKGGKGKKHERSLQEIRDEVEAFIGRMEAAAEDDVEANQAGKPCLNKLKLLPEVENTLAKLELQREFLDSGILATLKAWLEPLPNGALPNLNVRRILLEALHKLPVNVEEPERREQLKKSKLGQVVMFLQLNEEETQANRKLARQLVQKWSRPIFALSSQYRDLRRMNTDEDYGDAEAPKRRTAAKPSTAAAAAEDDEDEARKAASLKPGDQGYRWHARIPQKAAMDYTARPAPAIRPDEVAARSGAKSETQSARFAKQIQRKRTMSRMKTAAAANVSVEGRGLIHYNL